MNLSLKKETSNRATLLNIKEASLWASKYLNKKVTPSNISYLIQYGKIAKKENKGTTCIQKQELQQYYNLYSATKEQLWKEKLGDDLNWKLSFSECKEAETTKHVHRLHPYKGKFIPQLVEYFLDSHTDSFKKEAFFERGDIVLDPFCGSGTTLVQANELGMHSIGIDISRFNSFISNIKVGKYDFEDIQKEITKITHALKEFQKKKYILFEKKLAEKLNTFNKQHFTSPEFRYKVRRKEINEKSYSQQKSQEFLKIYYALVSEYKIQLCQKANISFLDRWFLEPVRSEIDFLFSKIKTIKNSKTKKLLSLILSRTIRSCRATTHADLATLKTKQIETYYCRKHGKICKPLFSVLGWWKRYSEDTLQRLKQYEMLRSESVQICLTGDSREISLIEEIKKRNSRFGKFVENQKIAGIFSSPPYVGLIDYHEQHAYAYDLFGFERNDKLEIGPLYKGQGKQAQNSYAEGIADVLAHCKQFLLKNADIFLVANDKYNLYPKIASLAGMKIINQYKRPVLNRVEKDRGAYAEIIFHLKIL